MVSWGFSSIWHLLYLRSCSRWKLMWYYFLCDFTFTFLWLEWVLNKGLVKSIGYRRLVVYSTLSYLVGVKMMIIYYLLRKSLSLLLNGGNGNGDGPWWLLIFVFFLIAVVFGDFGDLFSCSNDFPGNNTPMKPRPSWSEGSLCKSYKDVIWCSLKYAIFTHCCVIRV